MNPKPKLRSRGNSLIIGQVTIPVDGPTGDHNLNVEQFLKNVNVDPTKGLSKAEVKEKQLKDGPNRLTPVKETPLWIQFLQELYRGFGILLWLAALLCFLSWEPLGSPPSVYNFALALVLVFCALFQATFNFVQQRYSSNVMASFQKIIPKKCKVKREGTWDEIDPQEIVVGDIISVEAGEQFPADGRIIECRQAKIEKASLTGESEPIGLTINSTDVNMLETRNLGFFGSSLVEGTCIAVITSIGDNTVMGKIAKLTASHKESMTSLQKEINYFVALIALMSLSTGALLVIVWKAWLTNAYPTFINTATIIVDCIGVIIAFIPEGLPISVTMTLTLVARRMYKVQLMVKRMAVTETLGSATVVASDKTGTITQNKMSLSQIWCPKELKNPNEDIEPINMIDRHFSSFPDQALNLLHISALCNSGKQVRDGLNVSYEKKFIGSQTDIGLLRGATQYFNVDRLRLQLPIVAELPFSSRYKCQLTVHELKDLEIFEEKKQWGTIFGKPNAKYMKILKGAPEIILTKCTEVLIGESVTKLTDQYINSTILAAEHLAKQGERVIGLAYEYLTENERIEGAELDEHTHHLAGFCFAGLCSLMDPPKNGVKKAVDDCHDASIKVIMVTGDHPQTAIAIAKMVNIINKEDVTLYNSELSGQQRTEVETEKKAAPSKMNKFINSIKKYFVTSIYDRPKDPMVNGALAVLGKDISNLDDKDWAFIFSHRQLIFARTTPDHKLKIVLELQKRGEVVAVTGDGVNDAPALKASDIGVAMGSGTDVSKEAAKVILLDNNFETLIRGIEEGRLLFDNLQKVIAYLLPAGSFSEIMPVLANIFLGMPLPLTAFQMIIICVGSDMLGSLGLVYEHPEPGLMKRPPRDPKHDRMISWRVILYCYFQVGVLESIIAFFMYFYTMSYYGFPPGSVVLAFSNWEEDGYMNTEASYQIWVMQKAQTAFYVSLVMTQLWNLMCAKTRRESFFKSKFRPNLILYMIGEVIIVLLVCYLPPCNTYLSTAPADWYHFIFPLLMGSVILFVEEMRKLLVKKYPDGLLAKIAW